MLKKFVMLFSFAFLFVLASNLIVLAQDDFALPPPPDADESFAAPPVEGGELPPPPAEEASSELPPPAEAASSELPPPPAEEVSEETAPPPPVEEGETAPKAAASKYKVVKGDSLWKIAGKRSIYANSFKWPLIYRANKAIIEDPDLIYPRQNFKIRKDFSNDEVEDAVQKAKETPPYEPHTTPRKKLPIKY
jgi:LysM repeat protein